MKTSQSTVQSGPAAGQAERTRSGQTYRPNVDILEQPEELVMLVDLPGCQGDQIDVRFEDGELTIHAPVAPRQPAGTRYWLREYGVGDFYRTFRVSEQIDSQRMHASYAQGVLTLHLPKVQSAQPRKIPVAVGG
ncbi:MAG: Hsp20/alpha crystallin family protein [Pirellulales bacterium]|nr:Hsp20/alpha crystallin family protein [Pirellulales bacterium]